VIPDETIAEVLNRTDIIAFVGRHVTLKKAGTIFKGLCPFHDEKSPSFTVSPTRNTYHCFGCGAHGHAIKFLMEVGARNFPEAVKELAAECGVEVPEQRPESPQEKADRQEKKSLERRLLDVQDTVTAYYSDQLFGVGGERVRTYLVDRGISRRAAESFRLGWASGDKIAFQRFVSEHEIQLEDLVSLGILMVPRDGWNDALPLRGGYLRFRERLMFPVVDFRGDVTGYSGRILDNNKKIAKYMNSPESPVFTKGEQLYGAFTARTAARKAGRALLVEGNVDVIALWDRGLEGTVAAMGTALTPSQVRLVKRLSHQVICIMDGDEAGQKAAFASLIPFLESGMQPRAVTLPSGSDPDSYMAENGVEHFGKLLDSAPPLIDVLIAREVSSNPNDPPGRLAALRNIAPILARLTDALALDVYVNTIIDALGLTEDIIRRAIRETDKSSKILEISERSKGSDFQPGETGFRQNVAPPPLDDGYTGINHEVSVHQKRPQQAAFFVPGYVSQIFVFIIQYPDLVQHMYARDGHKYLTQAGLIAFFHSLYDEVIIGRTPNIDRILNGLGNPQVVAFLRGLQSLPLVIEVERVEEAFDDAMLRLQRGALEAERSRLNQEIRHVFSVDAVRCGELNEQLNRVRADLGRLSAGEAEGAG
jgi:DNA primase